MKSQQAFACWLFCVLKYFATAVAGFSCNFVLFRSASSCRAEYFATAVATFFRPASKEGKGAPTQRGSGSVEEEILYFTLSLTTKGVKERAILNFYYLLSTSADSPSCRGRLLPPFICANLRVSNPQNCHPWVASPRQRTIDESL